MSLGKATGIVLGKFRGAGIASFWIRADFVEEVMFGLELGGQGGFAWAEMGKKRFYRKGIMNKDPEARRHGESRARQGLWVEYEGTSWETRL